ncbi:MAG: hypothetical protein HONBIEJF_01675 [Fimbriimonadaceae bacterium]|nr:hypothetical protein [Fimbriimonadaceae bacterium]
MASEPLLQRLSSLYLDNAAATRDYRAQMRGKKSAALWGVYLGLLIMIGWLVYAQSAGPAVMSISAAQSKLRLFYGFVTGSLATAIILITPAMTATAIVAERQRKSLDMVFSAPVDPHYYLVGKMIAGYRSIWMLLVLSLPVTSACVVLGGATWSDVLLTYLCLSILGLFYTALGLLISTTSQKPTGAISQAYAVAFVYTFVTFGIGMMSTGLGSTLPSQERSFLPLINPYLVPHSISTFTRIGPWDVPNWILACVFVLMLVRITVLAAASALSTFESRETAMLRIHGLVYSFLLALWIASSFGGAGVAGIFSASSSSLGSAMGWLAFVISIIMCQIACFGQDLDRKFRYDGFWSLRQAIRGTPAGSLPYYLMIWAAIVVGGALGFRLVAGQFPDERYLAFAAWILGWFVLNWGLGAMISTANRFLRTSRAAVYILLVVLIALPIPILSYISAAGMAGVDNPNVWIWHLWVLYPLVADEQWRHLSAWGAGGVMLATGAIFGYFATKEMKRRREFERERFHAKEHPQHPAV